MKSLISSFLLVLTLIASSAFAAPLNYTEATFDNLQKAGKPTLVMIYAEWCPTCRAQAPIVSELLGKPEFKALTALKVDFDQQKDVVKGFKARSQSTLIVFKRGREVGRTTGDTKKETIAAMLKKAL